MHTEQSISACFLLIRALGCSKNQSNNVTSISVPAISTYNYKHDPA